MVDSNVECHTCQPVRSADAFLPFALRATPAWSPRHHCQSAMAELQRRSDCAATAPLPGRHQPGAAGKRLFIWLWQHHRLPVRGGQYDSSRSSSTDPKPIL